MFIDSQGNIYQGEMRLGDRAATTEEVAAWEALRNAPPSPQQQIDTIERQTLMNRATREFLIALAEKEGAALGLTPAQLMVVNKGYASVKAIDDQIKTLRAQIV